MNQKSTIVYLLHKTELINLIAISESDSIDNL